MEDDWDSIDWDVKVDSIVKSQQQQQQNQQVGEQENSSSFTFTDEDGNYYEKNQEKKQKKQKDQEWRTIQASTASKKPAEIFFQPFSNKELVRIRNFASSASTFHNLMYETFGQFERFLLTHQQDLTHEAIVELIHIDMALLEVPFSSHNQLLLREISKFAGFWSQLVQFVKEFLEHKHKDLNFLIAVDMNRFFGNIESIMFKLLVNNLFSPEMKSAFDEILKVLVAFEGNEWSRPEKLRNIQSEYERNLNVFRIYEVSEKKLF